MQGSPDYIYPHNYKNDYVKQEYMPDKLKNKKYYMKKDNKKYETNLNRIYEISFIFIIFFHIILLIF